MMKHENDLDESIAPPGYLCKKCGMCCRVIMTYYTFEELLELDKQGDEEARFFTRIFNRYSSIEEVRKLYPKRVDEILEALNEQGKDISKLSFYYCPHLQDDNSCDNYDGRASFCKNMPRNGWSLTDRNCGYRGWQFKKREKIKHTIRLLKERIYAIDLIELPKASENEKLKIEEAKKKLQEKITPWSKYGAEYW